MALSTSGTSPDAALAARDRTLVGLEVILDDERLTSELAAALPDDGVTAAEATYVRYKPGTACIVACRLTIDGAEVLAYVRLERPTAYGKLTKHARRAAAHSPLGHGAVLLPNVSGALYPAPNDRRIGALADLADEARRARILTRALPDRPALWPASLQPLRWKPERRYVGALEGEDGERAVVKAYAGGRFGDASRVATVLGGRTEPRTPRRLGRSRRAGVVVLEWLPGRPLEGDLLPGGAGVAGELLAQLHAISPPPLPLVTRDVEMQRVLRSVDTVSMLVPDARPAARRLAQSVARGLATDRRPAAAHGDFSHDQVLLHDGQAALVDLDDAVLSDPARDVGSFIASLWREVVGEQLSAEAAAAAREELLGGYGPVDRDALRAWTAAALLHLAPEPFRHRQRDWPARIRELLAIAEGLHDE